MNGNIIRSRAKWMLEGEKPSQYFCNLETRNYTSKTITRLILDDGQEISDQKLILKEIETFYKHLYKKRTDEVNDFDLDRIITFQTPK